MLGHELELTGLDMSNTELLNELNLRQNKISN
jgi:hypothetical protein